MISAKIKNQKENIVMEASFGVSFSWNVSQMKFLTFSTCISWKSKPKQAGSKPHISDQLDECFASANCFGYLSDRFSLSAMRNSFMRPEGSKLYLTNKVLCLSYLLLSSFFSTVAQLPGGQLSASICMHQHKYLLHFSGN